MYKNEVMDGLIIQTNDKFLSLSTKKWFFLYRANVSKPNCFRLLFLSTTNKEKKTITTDYFTFVNIFIFLNVKLNERKCKNGGLTNA